MTLSRYALLAAAACIAASSPAAAQTAPSKENQCFQFDQMQNWRAPDAKTVYISVRPQRYFRLDLAGACSALRWPGAILVRTVWGSSQICRPVDWDLKVSQAPGGFVQGCIVKSMTLLTPDEVAALPKGSKP